MAATFHNCDCKCNLMFLAQQRCNQIDSRLNDSSLGDNDEFYDWLLPNLDRADWQKLKPADMADMVERRRWCYCRIQSLKHLVTVLKKSQQAVGRSSIGILYRCCSLEDFQNTCSNLMVVYLSLLNTVFRKVLNPKKSQSLVFLEFSNFRKTVWDQRFPLLL